MNENAQTKVLSNSLTRGLLVLECFSPEKDRLSLADLTAVLDVPKSSLYRVVKTLCELAYLRYDDRARTYSLGTRVLSLGFSVLRSMELRELARPHLEELSRTFNKTVNLAILDKNDMVYVERVKVPGYRDFNIGIGSRITAWNTAVGWVVLAHLPENRLAAILGELGRLPDFMASGGAERLLARLRRARAEKFAINDRDYSKKWIRAIAVPVFSSAGVACAINIVVEPEDVSVEELRTKYGPVLIKAGSELSAALGYREAS